VFSPCISKWILWINKSEGTELKSSDLIAALASIIAALIGAFATWAVMKRQFASKRLTYSFSIEPLLSLTDPDLARDLTVHYKDELLPSPTLLDVEIVNVGLTAIEKAQVVITLQGTTYLIPGYFLEIPDGYSLLWDIERSDAEECTVRFEHINPKQVARIRLLMDEPPRREPKVSCAMPNVTLAKTSKAKLDLLSKSVGELLLSQLITSLNRWRPRTLRSHGMIQATLNREFPHCCLNQMPRRLDSFAPKELAATHSLGCKGGAVPLPAACVRVAKFLDRRAHMNSYETHTRREGLVSILALELGCSDSRTHWKEGQR
jgi:hypothetical protein